MKTSLLRLAGSSFIASHLLSAATVRAVPPPPPPGLLASGVALEGEGCLVHEEVWEVDCRLLVDSSTCATVLRQTLETACALKPATPDGALPVAGALLPGDGPTRRRVYEQRGRVSTGRSEAGGWVLSANEGRHLFMHAGRKPGRWRFEAVPAPSALRAPDYRVSLEVRADADFRLAPSFAARGTHPWTIAPGLLKGAWSPVPSEANAPSSVLAFEVADPGQTLHHGGLQLGLGASVRDARQLDGSFAPNDSFRARLEYEAAWNRYFFPGLSLDLDGDTGFVVTPRLEVATPHLLYVIPSLSLGLGLPVALKGDADVGLRFLAGLGLASLGFVFSYDWFPSAERADAMSFLARISL
jgi:hypothetical protein